jgi:hypothetical protein
MGEYNIEDVDVSIDYGGLGQGIGDRLYEKDIFVKKVMFGESADDSKRYMNKRAEMYYNLFKFIKGGGKIIRDNRFNELNLVNYKEDSDKRLKIQSKDEIKKFASEMGLDITSPDVADASALCFAKTGHEVSEDDFEFI